MSLLSSGWARQCLADLFSPLRNHKQTHRPAPSRAPGRQAPMRWRPTIEILEDRLTPSFLVTDIADTAGSATDVTLRYALNNAQNVDQIAFSSSLISSGPATILLTSALPEIDKNITITGLGAA